MESYLDALTRRALTPIYRRMALRRLAPLTSHESATVRSISLALRETITQTLSDEERSWVTAIEHRRKVLRLTKDIIEIIDFGAGNPDAKRSDEDMYRGVRSSVEIKTLARASKPAFWALFIFKLIRKLEPKSCLELGTALGISASYIAAALRINGAGSVCTLEGSSEIARLAQETFDLLNLDNVTTVVGPFHMTLSKALSDAKPIGFFFNDGHHDKNAVLRYYEDCQSSLGQGSVMVIDDISWSTGMRDAWTEIAQDSRNAYAFDFRIMGVVVKAQDERKRETFSIPLF